MCDMKIKSIIRGFKTINHIGCTSTLNSSNNQLHKWADF